MTKPSLKPAAAAARIAQAAAASSNPLAHVLPRGDRILVRRDAPQDTTAGGILLAPQALRHTPTGIVVRVGPGKLKDDGIYAQSDLKPGDRVVLVGFAGLDLNDAITMTVSDKDEYILIRDEDIAAVIP